MDSINAAAISETMPAVFHVLTKPTGATCNLDCKYCFFLVKENLYPGSNFRMSYDVQENYIRQVIESLMQKYRVEFNILTTVNAANGDYPREVYRFLRDEVGTKFIQLIPIVERVNDRGEVGNQEGSDVTERSVKSEQWGRFLSAIFDEWVRRDVGQIFVQMFDAALASWVGAPPAICIFTETCGNAVALEHNGDLYSCDHFVEPKYLVGNIQSQSLEQLVNSEPQRKFGSDKRDTLPRYCCQCDVRFACHGECPKNRFITTPDGELGLNYLCAGYMAFFRHINRPMKMMAELVRHGRYADEVKELLAIEEAKLRPDFAKTERNDP